MLAQGEGSVRVDRKSWLMPLVLLTGWFLLAASNGLAWLSKGGNTNASYVLRWEILNGAAGFAVSMLLFLVYARIQKRLSAPALICAAAVLCYGSGMLWRFLTGLAMWQFGLNKSFEPDPAMLFIRGGLMDGTTLGLVSFVYFGIEYWRQAAEQKEQARQATALAHQARLEMLRYQLNPHFLFNALNSIRLMIVEDPDRSRQMVTELAEFLRYSLDGKEQESTIGDEIQAIENYLTIQRIRYEEALDATVRLEPSAAEVAVPCFLIHPLVENAIKYGTETSATPLRVRIEVTREGEEITIRVSNTGRLLAQPGDRSAGASPERAGIGLQNVAERLRLVFPDRHSFQMRESEGWVHAEIQLQLAGQDSQHEIAHSAHRG